MAGLRWFLSGLAGHSLGTSHRVDTKAASDFKTKVCFLRQKFGLQGVALFEFILDKVMTGSFLKEGFHLMATITRLAQLA